MEWFYKALEQYTYITVRSVIFKLIALIAVFVLIRKKEDYAVYGAISIFAASASNVFNFINVHKYIGVKPIGNYNFKRHFKAVAVFFAMSCATTIYTNLDSVMLGFMTTDTDVGYYNTAMRIKAVLVSIVASLGAVLLPRASYYIENNMIDEFKKIGKKALKFVFIIAMPMAVYFIMFAKNGIYFLSGTEYSGAIVPMQIIMPTLLFIGIGNILGIQILVPLGKENYVLMSNIAGAIVDVILNALLIPKMASAGAATGTLITEAVVLLVQMYALRENIKELFAGISYIKIMFAVIVGVIASFGVCWFNWGDFITLAVSAVLFFGGYFGALLLLKEPLTLEIFENIYNITLKKILRKNY
jgi:O-antigen/teichoic acid export membrane protein